MLTPEIRQAVRRTTRHALALQLHRLKAPVGRQISAAVAKRVYEKQKAKIEGRIEASLAEMFQEQIKDAAARLKDMGIDGAKAVDSRSGMVADIFNPQEWNEELLRRVAPILAEGVAEGMEIQLKLMGVDGAEVRPYKATVSRPGSFITSCCRRPSRECPGCKGVTRLVKALEPATAEEMLEAYGEGVLFDTPIGSVNITHVTEYPAWMKNEIENLLRESFSQDYWAKVNLTTLGDIDDFLIKGFREGKSVETLANEMVPNLGGGTYAKKRGRLIARTEAGHALNGARSATIDAMIAEMGEQLPMKRTWISVLGATTRDAHADLDGVPAAEDGTWILGGVKCRWPGDVRLPPENRCNCLCSVVVSYGMTDSEANDLIADYQTRMEQQGKSMIWSMKGGSGSGNFGHTGDPPKVGGSFTSGVGGI